MKKAIVLVAGLLVFAARVPSAPQTAQRSSPRGQKRAEKSASKGASSIRHVIMVSVDGLMPASYTNPDGNRLKVPTLRELVAHGAASPGVRGVLPASTYPAHTTIVTGAYPRRHGVIANSVFDPLGNRDGEWFWYTEEIHVPTLWEMAKARGLHTALIAWPVTVGARADTVMPEFWRGTGADGATLLGAISTPGLFAAVKNRFPHFQEGITPPTLKDEALTDIAVQVIETAKPNLLLLHLPEVDHQEHSFGPWSPQAIAAIENADQQIARLIAAAKTAGTWSETALVLVSDHGFARQARVVKPGVLLRLKSLITMDEATHKKIVEWKAQILSSGGSAYVYLKDSSDAETRRIVEETFVPLAGKPGSGIARVLRVEEIAAMGGDSEAFLALEAADGYGFSGGATGDYEGDPPYPGLHGFSPDREAMQSSLVVYGPAIAAGKIEDARLIDIGPTVAGWLGLRLEQADGRPLLISLVTTEKHPR